MRNLKASDLGQVCKIINAIGVREFKTAIDVNSLKGADPSTLGVEIMFGIGGVIIEHIPAAQKEIDTFLASLTGQKITEIQNMSLKDYTDLLFQVITKEDFQDFFTHVMKLFNR